MITKISQAKIDGVAKNPIYGAVTVFSNETYVHVLSHPKKTVMPCIWNFKATPSTLYKRLPGHESGFFYPHDIKNSRGYVGENPGSQARPFSRVVGHDE